MTSIKAGQGRGCQPRGGSFFIREEEMSFIKAVSAGTVVFALTAAAPALAQDAGPGAEIYAERCAVCHGEGGQGDGLVGELFAKKPSDLTLLAKNNNGAFPFSEVYQAIDGRREITGHGRSEMPIWGEFFMDSAISDPRINEKDARMLTQARILSVVYFLQSIQGN
ncbi:MAG: c-type cytochrome [Paracoccaceae bacterium]